jgi:hypothetical protein
MPSSKIPGKKKMSIADGTRAHFSKATKAGKLIRTAFARLLFNIGDVQATGRLTSAMLKVIQTDDHHPYGMKSANTGSLSILQGFEFNKKKEFGKTFFAPFEVDINRVTGVCTLKLPSFLPETVVRLPQADCQCRLVVAGGAFDFEVERYYADIQTSEYFMQGKPATLVLRMQLPPNQHLPIILLMGVEFYKKVNDQYLLLYGGGPLALRVVHTSQLPVAAAGS